MNAGTRRTFRALFSTALVAFALAFAPGLVLAQTGTLTGTVIDAETGETLIGANVLVEGTLIGTSTDLDGGYRITGIPVGTHNIRFSFIGYQQTTVRNVDISEDEVERLDVSLVPEAFELEGDVIVEARALRNNEAVLLKDRQKSSAVSDAISAEAISRSGSGDAASAMQKVTGASVVGGKYVYVRGLGDRYTNTTLNGSTLPSADPDRKAVQLDMFPSSLLENIVTLKTFTPDRPGNFSGGLVDVATKSFPDDFTLQWSVSLTYDEYASNSDNFLLYQGGNSDWMGVDDGTRGLPSELKGKNPETPIPNEQDLRDVRLGVTNEIRAARADSLNSFARAFNHIMAPTVESAPYNYSLSGAIGGQSEVPGGSLGYTGSVSYGRTYSFYDDGVYSQWELTGGGVDDVDNLTSNTYFGPQPNLETITRADPMEVDSFQNIRGSEQIDWGLSGSLAYKLGSHNEFNLTALRTQSGKSEATQLAGFRDQNASATFITRSLDFEERSLQSYQLRGEHYLKPVTIEWRSSYGRNTQEEPDLRYFSSVQNIQELAVGIDTTYSLGGGNAPPPQRYFRDLTEDSRGLQLDISIPFKPWKSLSAKLKFGGAYDEANRVFRQRRFDYQEGRAVDFRDFNGNVAAYFSPSNFGVLDTLRVGEIVAYNAGIYLKESSPPRANYDADREIMAVYGMIELPITRRLKVITGARLETTDILTESFDETLPDSIRMGTLDQTDILPSMNIVLGLTDNMNLRAAATRTVARPTFRELAPFQSFDFVGGDIREGNPTLDRTLITNLDLRWEWFMNSGEIMAVSGFYKHFESPIERVLRTVGEGRFVSYQNVDAARVYGTEFEVRKGLGFVGSRSLFDRLSLGGNFSIVHSVVDIPEEEMVIIRSGDPDADDTRQLEGQSPFLLNLNASYENYESGTTLGLYYHVFGDRLLVVTSGATPDVFEKARADLDFTFSQELPNRLKIKFSAKNLLGTDHRQIQTFKNVVYDYISYSRSRTFSLGLSYEI